MRSLGIDVGTVSVKGVLVSGGLFGPRVVDAHEVAVGPAGPEEAVRALVQTMGRPGAAVASLDRRDVTMRLVEVPTRDHAQIRRLAPFQLEEQANVAQEALFDGCPVAPSGPRGSFALLMAVPREAYARRLALARLAPGAEASCGVDALAAVNVLALLSPPGPGVEVLLDVGAAKTVLSVLVEGRLVGTRLLLAGLPTGGAADAADPLEEALAESLAADARRALLGFGAPTTGLRRVVVVGGGGERPNLVSRLGATLGCPAVALRPALGRELAPRFAAALGLALAPLRRLALPVDFEHQSRPHPLLERQNLFLAAGTVAVLALYHLGGLMLEHRALAAADARLESQAAALAKDAGRGPLALKPGEAPAQALARARKRLAELSRTSASAARILREISHQIGEAPVTLLALNLQADHVKIEAEADSFQTADRVKGALAKSNLFTDIKYETATNVGQLSQGKLMFNLTFRLRAADGGQGGG